MPTLNYEISLSKLMKNENKRENHFTTTRKRLMDIGKCEYKEYVDCSGKSEKILKKKSNKQEVCCDQ